MGHYENWIQNEGDLVVVIQSLRPLYFYWNVIFWPYLNSDWWNFHENFYLGNYTHQCKKFKFDAYLSIISSTLL